MSFGRVSIIIRNYNYGRFLRDAIDSALAQTHPETEVIVVDDGSTDGSRDVIKSYGDRVIAVLQRNGGEGAGVNSGFAAASGEWIIFLDSDDALAADCAARIIDAVTPETCRITWMKYTMDEAGRLLGTVWPPRLLPELSFETAFATIGLMPSIGQSFNAYRRSALAKALPLDAARWNRSPDTWLNAVTTAQGHTHHLQAVLGFWRHHGQNLSAADALDYAGPRNHMAVHPRLHADLRLWLGPDDARMAAADYAYTHYRDRLLSLRLDPAGHPYPEDGVERLRLQLESRTSALSVLGMRFAPLRRLKIGLLARLPVPLLRWANPRMTRLRRALTFRLSGRNRFALMAPRGVRRGAHWRSVPGALGDKLDRRVPE